MSARAEFRDDKRHRAFHRIVEQCRPAYGWMKWHDLPAGSFAHAGTNINTVILAITKPDCSEQRPASLCRTRAAPLIFPPPHARQTWNDYRDDDVQGRGCAAGLYSFNPFCLT